MAFALSPRPPRPPKPGDRALQASGERGMYLECRSPSPAAHPTAPGWHVPLPTEVLGGCREKLDEGKMSTPQGQALDTHPVCVVGPPFSSLLPRTPHCADMKCLASAPFVLLETVLKEALDILHIHKRVWTRFLSWPLSPLSLRPISCLSLQLCSWPNARGGFPRASPTVPSAPRLCTEHPTS